MPSTPSHLDASGKPALKRVGGFEIINLVGEGGMGAVYRAKQTSLDRPVALKVLAPHLAANAGYIDSFIREARAAARLNHPNIIPVFDAGKADDVYYYAMEFVEGETLYKWVKREGALPEKMALEIALCVANALKNAWDKEQLIHRDVKPENVMIDLRGNVKLCDLGLAKYFGENTLMSLSGQAFGTPNYMAPEQARAERTVDCRADIYALGMTLYYALTAQIPFHGGSAALVMARHMTEQLADPREFSPEVSADTCFLLQRMLAKDANDRFQNWSDVIRELERLRNGEQVSAPPLPAGKSSLRLRDLSDAPAPAAATRTKLLQQPTRSGTGKPIGVAIAAALVVLLLLAGGVYFFFSQPPQIANNDDNGAPLRPVNPLPPPPANPAAEQWAQLKTFAAANPAALDELAKRLQKFLADFPDAPEKTEAAKLLAETAAKQSAARQPNEATLEQLREKRTEAIEASLRWLANTQQPDGAFSKIPGVSALAIRAFLAAGHAPGDKGPYGDKLHRAVENLLAQQDASGFFGGGNGRMYGHGMATQMLAEVYALTKDAAVKAALERAVKLILEAQAIPKAPQHQGGWRYTPTSRDSDLSVTGWQLATLLAAREAGIEVPDKSIESALAYVKRCAHPNGGFGYTGPAQTPSTSTVGVFALLKAGDGNDPSIAPAIALVAKNPFANNMWFFYTLYHGTHAMWLRGGNDWQMWEPVLLRALIPQQRADGSFPRGGGTEGSQGGEVYATAMAALALSAQDEKFAALKKIAPRATAPFVNRAASKWKEALDFERANPDNVARFKELLDELIKSFPHSAEAADARKKLAEFTARETAARQRAQQAWSELTQQIPADLAQRRYAAAAQRARELSALPEMTSIAPRLQLAESIASNLDRFWQSLPAVFTKLVGKEVTVQNTRGKVAEVARDEIVLEIAANAMVGFSISQLATEEIVTLSLAAHGDSDAAALLNLAWFCFAEGNLKTCDQLLDLAQRKGGDAITAREQMALLSTASVEFEAEKIYNEILALIAAKRWSEAQEKVRDFKKRFASTKAFAAAQANLAQWEIALPLEVEAAKKAGNLVHTLSGHNHAVVSVAVSPDGRAVLTASLDKSVRLWDLVTGREARVLGQHNEGVRGAVFTPDGRRAVSAGDDRTMRVWNLTGGEALSKQFGQRPLFSVAVSPDGKWAAVGEDYATVRIIEIASGEHLRQVKVGASGVLSIDFSPNGKFLLIGDEFGNLALFETSTWKEARSFKPQSAGAFGAVSPDSRYIVGSGGNTKTIRLWEIETGRELRQFNGHTDNVRCVAFSRDGKFILSGGNDKTVRLWDAATGRLLKTFEGHAGAVRSVAFSADGKFGVSASDDKTAKIWKLDGDGGAAIPALTQGGALVATWQGHTAPVNCLALSPDGRAVISGSYDNTLRLWDVVTGREIRQFRGHEKGARGVAFSPDGKLIASAGEDNVCRLWDADSGREIRSIGATNRWMLHASFSPDGKWLATATAGGSVRKWDWSDPSLGWKDFHGLSSPVYTVLFSPDNKLLLAASEAGNAKLYNAESGAELQTLRGQSGMYCAAMSADGKFVLAGSHNRSFKMWETASGREVRQFDGHTDIVRALAFSRDGRFILSGADDKTVRLWDAASGRLLKTFEGHTDKVRGVTFTADGRFAISCSADHTLKVWRLWDDAHQQSAAPARPQASPLEEEIQHYIVNMRHHDLSKRIEAQRELKKIGKPALPFLIPLTEDRDHSVRVAASILIASMRDDAKPDATFAAGFGVKLTDKGFVIVEVTPSSPAETLGIQRGDIVTHANGYEIKTLTQLQTAFSPVKFADTPTVLDVIRDGKPLKFHVPRR